LGRCVSVCGMNEIEANPKNLRLLTLKLQIHSLLRATIHN